MGFRKEYKTKITSSTPIYLITSAEVRSHEGEKKKNSMLMKWKKIHFEIVNDTFANLKLNETIALEDLDQIDTEFEFNAYVETENWMDHVWVITELQVWVMIFIKTKQKVVPVMLNYHLNIYQFFNFYLPFSPISIKWDSKLGCFFDFFSKVFNIYHQI